MAALSYTVTAQDASAIAASNVTQTLQLVPGLTSNGGTVSFTINGLSSATPTYDNTTGLVNFTPTAIALAANTTNTYVANFTKAPVSGPITATANIGSTAGSNGPELNRTNNFATNTVNITPSYDVSTTITGSVNAAGVAAPVVSGNLVTYLVRTTNAAGSASPASRRYSDRDLRWQPDRGGRWHDHRPLYLDGRHGGLQLGHQQNGSNLPDPEHAAHRPDSDQYHQLRGPCCQLQCYRQRAGQRRGYSGCR